MTKAKAKTPASKPAAKTRPRLFDIARPVPPDVVHRAPQGPTAVEILPPSAPAGLTSEDRARVDGVLGMVRQDIRNAEIGRFFAMRAGVGLIVVKELCDHGEWGQEMIRMIPDRSPRTLRKYMAEARDFLDSKAIMARDIWDKLASVGSSALGAAAAGLLLGDGSERTANDPAVEVPDEVRAMADYLREDAALASQAKAQPQAPRALSAGEKRKAASDLWQALAGRVTDEGIARQTWQILDAETLETVASALRTVADKMMSAARKAKHAK